MADAYSLEENLAHAANQALHRMEKKLNPLEMVARELSLAVPYGIERQSEEELAESLREALLHLGDRARAELNNNAGSQKALDCARQYQAMAEVVLYLGNALMEAEDEEYAVGPSDELNN